MPVAEQNPGRLNLAFKRGDFFSTAIDFSNDLTGKTVTAALLSVPQHQAVGSFTVTPTNLASGQVNVSMSAEATAELEVGTYGWSLVWSAGAEVRTALEGYVEVS